MNEIEKQKYFTLTDAVNTSVISTSRDIRDIKPIKDIEAPKYKTLTDAVRGFKFNQEIIDDIQKNLNEVPEATVGQKIKAGGESWLLGLKQAPESVRNLIYRHFQGMEYPNATSRQAFAIAEASAIRMNNEKSLLQMRQTEEGTADSVIANLTSGALSVGEFALMGLATGGLGYTLMGAQEAGDLSQEFVSKDIESGKIYEAGYKGQSLKEVIAADTYGAVAGWIEKGLGVEQSISEAWLSLAKQGAKSATKKSVGEAIVKGSIGEGLEEFLQGEASWATGKIVSKEDKDFYEGFQDSLISGVYGAILGGAFGGASTGLENGVARYYQARQDMASILMNKGIDQKEAVQIADNTLTSAVDFITTELEGRNSLQTYFGEDWNKLVDGVAQAYISQGWEQRFPDKDVREFAEMNAKAMVAPVIELSNRTNMPLKQILDLANFRQNENALFIDMPNVDDPKALGIEIKNRKAEIKRLRAMPATQATDTIKRLKDQVKVLELRLNNLTSYNAIEKARMDSRKANLDNDLLASTRPEIVANLGGIRQAQRGESFVYVGNNQVPVRYVVKPMAEVQASHIAGEANPNYTLKELQNRTRGTVTDDAILQNRAANLKPEELAESPNTQYGAPVVNKNGEVISGNGRMETLRRAYELGNTNYKEMLDSLGYNTEGIERPVLVRETIDDLTPEQQVAIAEASNVSETSAFDHARQAMNDAKLLKKGISDPVTFADELPVSERQSYIRENGQYDLLALQRRFDDAVLAWIIGDTKTFDSLVLANRLNQKVIKGISMQGGNIVEFSKSNPTLGIKKDLRYALVKSASIKTRGHFIPAVQQQDIEEGISFNADALLYAMTFSNNSSELSNFIGQYVQTHQSYIDGQKDSFLADSLPKLSKEDITNQVLLNNPLTASKFDKDGTCTDSNLKAVILNRIPVENVGYGTIKIEPEEANTKEQEIVETVEEKIEQITEEKNGEKEESLAEIVSEAVEEKGLTGETEKIEDYGEKLEGAKKDLVEKSDGKKDKTTAKDSISKIMKKAPETTDREYLEAWLKEQPQEFVDNIAAYNHKLEASKTWEYRGRLSDMFREHLADRDVRNLDERDIIYGNANPPQELIERYNLQPEKKVYVIESKGIRAVVTPEYIERKLGNRGQVQFQYNKSTRGSYFLWVKKGTGGWNILEKFNSKEEMEEHKKNHTKEQLEQLLKEKTDITPKEKIIRERQGKDHRKGKNVTAKDFSDTFGFRGVQFGNYEDNEKRQRELNNAYDSLMDMAEILNIPPKAISLNGSLGIAFGARGAGSATAHYEPKDKIINITRDAGAGALGHEWFHAIDNYFAGEDKFVTTGRYDAMKGMRDELRQKLIRFLSAIEMERDYKSRLALLGQYWKRKWEVGARAFETYLVNKMDEKGIVNDYLAQDHSESIPYLNKEEQKEVLPKLDEFFNTLKYRETDKGIELYQESMDVAIENARLDDIYPEYKGETITINGKERTVYNSNGDRIAKSKEALENFYKWFGDSKVVDKQGRPLVVYHSTDVEFSVFDKTKADSSVGLPAFYFSSSEQYSREYGSITMPVYLKAENVFNIGKDVPDGWYELKTNEERVDLLKKQGYDGVFDYNAGATEYAVFEPNQIKSTSNRGTYSESENIYYQSAFAGSRVDYDRPSLEAIGSGEGNQAHGWGLYYALNRDVAEGYRKGFTEGKTNIIIGDKSIEEWVNSYEWNNDTYDIADNIIDDIKRHLENNNVSDSFEARQIILNDIGYHQKSFQYAVKNNPSSDEYYAKREIENLNNLTELLNKIATYSQKEIKVEQQKGQVHEVDIPENPYLLDEQAGYEAQPELVKKVFDRISEEFGIKTKGTLQVGNEQKEINGKYVYNHLADKLGSPRQASMWLNEQGIKGITYDGKQDGRCFVIFNPDDVKVIQKFYQRGKANINGYFDAELKTIVIGSSFNFGTLQHEFAHFFLKRVFDIYKTGAGTQEFNDWFSQLSSILDIKADQFALTTPQQEQFARMTESYLFNKAEFPEGAKPAMQMFFDWCPAEYNELLSIGWKDDKGIYHNSVFNKESLDFFNDMYSLVPELGDSPLVRTFTNETNRNGTIIPADTEQRKEREKLIGETPVETVTAETTQASINIQNTPDPEVEKAYKEAIETEQERKKTPVEKFTQYVRIGRGTNTREEMDELAQDYIKKHRENAERVAFGNPIPSGYEDETGLSLGYVENNTGIDRAVLILNLMNEYTPNSPEYNQLYHNFAIYRSYASKSAGLTNDVNTNYYLKGYVEINKALTQKAALVKYGKTDNAVNLWNRDIDRFISQNIDKVYNTEPESAERDKAITQFIDDAKAMFGSDESVLLQEEIRIKKAKDKQAFIDWANRVVKQIAKGKMPPMDEAKLMDLSVKAQKASKFIDSNNVDEAVAASQDIRAWQDFVNQKGLPESFVDKIIGTYLPSAMLSSPSTHALNAVSNFFNNVAIRAATRLHYGANVISGDVLEKEYNRLKAIYAESGHNLSEDNKPDDVSRLHGEHWQFKKPESALGYLSPMRLLGWSDFYFRAHTYVDTLARIASQDAKGDQKKALELFNEYKQMNSVNQRAKEARLQAIMTGHIAVFTNNGTLANISAGMRHYLDYINLVEIGKGGHKGLGTLIMPFAKVPANIVGMGIQAVSSPFKLLGKWTGIKKDWTIQDSIALTNFGLFSSIVGIYLMAGLDYEPPYEPPHKYDPNKPYDSIKIGGAWVSVESFGALANPLRFTFTMLDMISNGKKVEPSLIKAIEGIKNDIPFTSVEFDNDYMKRKPADWLVSATYNQLSKAVPAAVKKPIAWTNRALGLQIEQDSALKRKIARQYGLDGKQTTINDYLTYIYRGIKVDTK